MHEPAAPTGTHWDELGAAALPPPDLGPVPPGHRPAQAAGAATGLYWFALVCTGLLFLWVCTCLHWSVLVYIGSYWLFLGVSTGCSYGFLQGLVCGGLSWFILVCTGLYWSLLFYTGLCWLFLGLSMTLYWSVLVRSSLYWFVLNCAGLYWFVLVHTGL